MFVTPLEAYRRDLERLGPFETFGLEDADWLAAAFALQRYVAASPAQRTRLGTELAAYLAAGDETTVCTAALRIAFYMDKAGAFNLAASWLGLLEEIIREDRYLEVGRVLARRASVTRKLGDTSLSHGLYQQVEDLGTMHAEPELTGRAWLGYAILAQVRGNYPEARRWYGGAALIADDIDCAELGFSAHIGLLNCAALARNFNVALREGWRAYEIGRGDTDRESEVLVDLAQILHDCGFYRTALRGFAAATTRSRYADSLLPALGGVAMSAARLGEATIVDAAADQLERAVVTAWSYLQALALLEMRDAYLIIGRTAEAERYRERAERIATQRSYHEIVHKLAHPNVQATSDDTVLDAEGTRIALHIDGIDAPAELIGC